MTTKPNEPARTSSVFVALVGRPNVGKSSLTNRLVGEKVAIVTQKPQTTRNRIMGIVTKGPVQFVLMDTPGIHKPRNKLDARMTQTASASLADVDVTLMLFEPAGDFTESELKMVEALKKAGPAVGVINKVDLLSDFAALEARRRQVEELGVFDKVLTLSAMDGTGCDALFDVLAPYGSPGPHYFDSFKERPDRDLIDITVAITCEKKSHKGMVIGKGGQMLKKIATAARLDCEELLGTKVNLQCWVKVREGWRDNERQLDNLGFAKP